MKAFRKKPSLNAPDKRIATSHNLPVNLPVKGQATAEKTVGTIEKSSEKINLWSCCKGKIIGFKGQCEREDFISISSKASLPFQSLPAVFLGMRYPSIEAVYLFLALSCLFCPPQFTVYWKMWTFSCSSLEWFTIPKSLLYLLNWSLLVSFIRSISTSFQKTENQIC